MDVDTAIASVIGLDDDVSQASNSGPRLTLKLGTQPNGSKSAEGSLAQSRTKFRKRNASQSTVTEEHARATGAASADDLLLEEIMSLEKEPHTHQSSGSPAIHKGEDPLRGSTKPAHIASSKPSIKIKKPAANGGDKSKYIEVGLWKKESTPKASRNHGSPLPAPTSINEKKCREILKALQKQPQAIWFLRPVDAERDGCPT